MPKIYLRENEENGYEFEVVDGQQRLRTIWSFFNNEFPMGDKAENYNDIPDLAGKFYKDLSAEVQEKLHSFEISITTLVKATEIETRELFLRLQEGKSLNPAEKRNAMPGNMRDFVSSLVEKNSVFGKIRIKNDRFQHDDWAAHIVCIALQGGATEISAPVLLKMYSDNKSFDLEGKKAGEIKSVLNYMARVLKEQPPEMDIKWGFVDLFLLIWKLRKNYVVKNRETDFLEFFKGFETARRSVDDPSELISDPSSSSWDRDLYDYIESFQRRGSTRENIEKRNFVYLNRFLDAFPDLIFEAKDGKRNFSSEQRLVLWRRAGEKCEECGMTLEFNSMEGDHIKPHSLGGVTTIENGQCLCSGCNKKKSSKIEAS